MADETLSSALTPELLRALHEAVEAGDYASPDEAARDAVRQWQDRRRDHAARLDAIRARIRRSLDDPRPDLSSEEVDAHLQETFRKARARRGAAA